MDAWETLTANSTIDTGDAWEHLLAQGGEGNADVVVLADGLGINIDNKAIATMVPTDEMTVSITDGQIIAQVDGSEIAIHVQSDKLNVEITNG